MLSAAGKSFSELGQQTIAPDSSCMKSQPVRCSPVQRKHTLIIISARTKGHARANYTATCLLTPRRAHTETHMHIQMCTHPHVRSLIMEKHTQMLDLSAVTQAFSYRVPVEDTDVTFFGKVYMANQVKAVKCV